MKSSATNPRTMDRVLRRYEVDLATDDQANCSSCGAAIYWIWIKNAKGEVKKHPVSEASPSRAACPDCDGRGYLPRPDEPTPEPLESLTCRRCRGSGEIVYLGSHFGDCPNAQRFRRSKR